MFSSGYANRSRNAGFFVYVNLSPYLPKDARMDREKEFAIAQSLLDAGVFMHPGEEHAKRPGWFRMVFAHHEDVLKEGLKRYVLSDFFGAIRCDFIANGRRIGWLRWCKPWSKNSRIGYSYCLGSLRTYISF